MIQKGLSDAPLTEKGQVQARALGKRFVVEGKAPDFHISPMRRARQTAQGIAK